MPDYSKMTDEQLQDIMAQGGGGGKAPAVDSGFFEDIGGYLKRHGEIPGGIGGAILGGAAGTLVAGPYGTIVGAALGGSAGSAGGSLASDAAYGEDLDFKEAGKEAAISLGFDVATLGAGKILKPVAHALGLSGSGLNGLFKKAHDVADEVVDMSKINANTLESMRVTQKFLTEKGGTLSAAQTGQSNVLFRMMEGIGDIGVLSGRQAAARIERNNQIIHQSIKDLAERELDVAAEYTMKGAGEVLYGAVVAGRTAAKSLLDDGVNALVKEHGQRTVSTLPVVKALRKFQMKNTGDIANTVSDSTLAKTSKMMDDLLDRAGPLATSKQADLKSLLDFEKSLQRDIQRAMPNSAFNDPVAVAELTQLKKAVQEGITETLEKISPNAGANFRKLNAEYSDTLTNLLPPSLGSAFTKASKNDFDALGRMMVGGTNQSNIGLMMKSLDSAYAAAKKSGIDMSDYPAKNADDARKFIRQSYVQNVFSTVGEATDLSKFAGKAAQLSTKEAMARAKAVLGTDFDNYKKIVNAISDTSVGQKSNMFGLAVRQKEVGSITGLAQIGGALASGATLTGTGGLGAVAVLMSPIILGKLATNKRAVNMLLGLNAEVKRGVIDANQLPAAVGRILESLDDHDKEDIKRLSR